MPPFLRIKKRAQQGSLEVYDFSLKFYHNYLLCSNSHSTTS
ncbi:MAG TPA: hypothetical protein DDW32_00300 [Thermotoga sp.]|nr:hypothetical protein [Thermotoga sp.]HBT99737.1 hypothetical protein [Thermotoga petrophila]